MKKVDNGILEKIYYIDNELSKKNIWWVWVFHKTKRMPH